MAHVLTGDVSAYFPRDSKSRKRVNWGFVMLLGSGLLFWTGVITAIATLAGA